MKMVKKKKTKKKGLKRRLVKKSKVSKIKVRKIVKKARISKKSKVDDDFVVGFEEIKVTCASCGREFRVVKSSGFSMDGMLCQRCAAGGGVGFEGSDDY